MSTQQRPDDRGNDAPPPDGPDGTAMTRSGGTGVEMVATHQTAAEGGALVLAARAEAEIKARAFIAIQRPRDISRFRRRLLEACVRPRFADAAIYSKPMGEGKPIEGLSIRFAEECARQYGNLDISSMVIGENDEYRTVECSVTDLETNSVWRQNVVVPKTIERKAQKKGDEIIRTRTNSRGDIVYIRRATMDEVFTQQNALISKTVRTLILNHIPSDIREEAYEEMESVLKGEIRADPIGYRKRQVDSFYRLGVTEQQLTEFLGKPHGDANEAELNALASVGRGIKQGEATWAEVMELKRGGKAPTTAAATGEAPTPAAKGAGATAELKERLAKDSAPAMAVPQSIQDIRKKKPKDRNPEEQEDLRQFEQDYPGL